MIRDQTHNPSVAGSSPARPTRKPLVKVLIEPDGPARPAEVFRIGHAFSHLPYLVRVNVRHIGGTYSGFTRAPDALTAHPKWQ
jgi:hypothetical protein